MRVLLILAVLALVPACVGPTASQPDDPVVPEAVIEAAESPVVPQDIIEAIEPPADVPVELDTETLERLKLLAGESGEVEIPSTRSDLARCERGVPAACTSVGTYLMYGTWGLQHDPEAAVPLFRYACDAGDLEGCHSLGVALKFGRGVPQDKAASVPLFERACNGGDAVACSFYGDAFLFGQGVERDLARGVGIYERACFLGGFCHYVAQHRHMLLSSDPARPFQDADESPEAACEAGDPQGCYWQALALAFENDSDERYAQAEQLLDRACDGEVADACASLGFHYLHRQSSPGYVASASSAFRRACDLGIACDHLEACPTEDTTRVQALARGVQQAEEDCQSGQVSRCLSLAISLSTGTGVERDPVRAASLLERVCSSGDPAGCWYLGGAYKRGHGVPKDPVRAAELHRAACDADHANGCVDLAFAHVHGRGVPQDLPTAVSLFDKACTLGTACDHAESYRSKLP